MRVSGWKTGGWSKYDAAVLAWADVSFRPKYVVLGPCISNFLPTVEFYFRILCFTPIVLKNPFLRTVFYYSILCFALYSNVESFASHIWFLADNVGRQRWWCTQPGGDLHCGTNGGRSQVHCSVSVRYDKFYLIIIIIIS